MSRLLLEKEGREEEEDDVGARINRDIYTLCTAMVTLSKKEKSTKLDIYTIFSAIYLSL
jgi:hypothetical protein